jgi:hypothetical protein
MALVALRDVFVPSLFFVVRDPIAISDPDAGANHEDRRHEGRRRLSLSVSDERPAPQARAARRAAGWSSEGHG